MKKRKKGHAKIIKLSGFQLIFFKFGKLIKVFTRDMCNKTV